MEAALRQPVMQTGTISEEKWNGLHSVEELDKALKTIIHNHFLNPSRIIVWLIDNDLSYKAVNSIASLPLCCYAVSSISQSQKVLYIDNGPALDLEWVGNGNE